MTDSVPFFSALLIFLRLIFRKLTESCPVAWWYSIVCLLLSISPDEYSALDFLLGEVLNKELAWASLIMLTVTTGGDMWTFNLVPTKSLTVAEKRVLVFKT